MKPGLRIFAREPAFAATIVFVLALGIGLSSAMFSIVQATLVRTLPFPDPERLVKIASVPLAPASAATLPVSPAEFIDWQAGHAGFEALAAYQGRVLNLTGHDRPAALSAVAASADLFAVLQARPRLGRAFVPEDDTPGAGPVAILSERLWQTAFAGDPQILGREIVLDGKGYVVIGVMGDLSCPVWGPASAQIWIPLAWSAQEREARDTRNSNVIARLKPGVGVPQAQAELNVLGRRLDEQHPGVERGFGARVVSVQDYLVGAVRPALLLLMGAVAFVLLIACVNVSNLVLARTLRRRREIAIRAALGASRFRMVCELVGEVVWLSLVGGGLGLVVAHWGIDLAKSFLGPRAEGAGLDGRVLAFDCALSVLAGVVTGLLPALRVTGRDLSQALGRGRTAAGSGPRTAWDALIVSEVALSLVLLIGAGLMVRSLWGLWSVDPGFDPRGLLTLEIKIPDDKYPQPAQQARFFADVLARAGALPGVDSAAAVDVLPLTGEPARESITVNSDGPSGSNPESAEVGEIAASPSYRRTMHIPLRRGRDLADADDLESAAVVLVSESLARRYWPHEDAVGRRISLATSSGVSREVVGVVGDVRQSSLDGPDIAPTVYVPLAQKPASWLSLVVRTNAPHTSIARAVANAIQDVDNDQPIGAISSMDEVIADVLYERQFSMVLLVIFASLALVLAAVGIYGVLAFVVGGRVREIGVRMALGARKGELLRLIVGEGMRPTVMGLGVGLGVALAVRRVLATLLYGVSSADPATFAAVTLLLATVAFLASLLPALRATRVEVVQALREE